MSKPSLVVVSMGPLAAEPEVAVPRGPRGSRRARLYGLVQLAQEGVNLVDALAADRHGPRIFKCDQVVAGAEAWPDIGHTCRHMRECRLCAGEGKGHPQRRLWPAGSSMCSVNHC